MNLGVACLRLLRQARMCLRQGLPVSALQCLMNAQGRYYRACQAEYPPLALNRMRRCIKVVEDQVYPLADLRGRRAS